MLNQYITKYHSGQCKGLSRKYGFNVTEVCPAANSSTHIIGTVLAAGVKYWNKQGGKCLCEEQDKEQLFSFFGILGSE